MMPPALHASSKKESCIFKETPCVFFFPCFPKILENDGNGVDMDNCTVRRYVEKIGEILRQLDAFSLPQ